MVFGELMLYELLYDVWFVCVLLYGIGIWDVFDVCYC